jgi:sigma-54 specific flagellar transcriptional regulator A
MERENRGSVRLSKKAVAMLQHYRWPGNVRELANLLERLAILYPYAVIDAKNLPEKYQSSDFIETNLSYEDEAFVSIAHPNISLLPSCGIDMKQYLTDIEISLIEQALVSTNHVVARAATMLNVRRTTLVEKMRKYEIE